MFKSELDGLYHREQIADYLREAERNPFSSHTRRRRQFIAAVIITGTLAILCTLANLSSALTSLSAVP